MDSLAVLVISLGFGMLFLGTTSHKIREFAQFRVVLADYQLLPGALVLPAASLVVAIELALTLTWFSVVWTPLATVSASSIAKQKCESPASRQESLLSA